MNYKYAIVNGSFVINKQNDKTIKCYQEHEYFFDKKLSEKIATCIYRYIQVANFQYKEGYKKRLLEDYNFLISIVKGDD